VLAESPFAVNVKVPDATVKGEPVIGLAKLLSVATSITVLYGFAFPFSEAAQFKVKEVVVAEPIVKVPGACKQFVIEPESGFCAKYNGPPVQTEFAE
jgi:hypothetical protein